MMDKLVECVGLGKRYGSIWVFRGLTYSFEFGRAVAILGTSGSGKTTLLKIIGLISRPSEGFIRIRGVDPYSSNVDISEIRKGIGYSFQEPLFVEYLGVLDNVMLPLIPYLEEPNLSRAKKKAIDILERMGLSKYINFHPAKLSTGERKRVDLARALVKDPDILLVDEPTANLDEESADIIRSILIEAKETGKLVVYALHRDEKLISICDKRIELLNYKTD